LPINTMLRKEKDGNKLINTYATYNLHLCRNIPGMTWKKTLNQNQLNFLIL